MKRKFLILTLCFTIIFSSVNLKKVDAIDFVISPTMLAVVSTLAVGTGIALRSSDDIYDIGRLFYDYVSNHNSLTWETVKTVFDANVTLLSNGKVSVGSDFINICKGAFSNYFSTTEDVSLEGYNFAKYGDIKTSNYFGSVPIYSIPSVLTYSPPYDKRGINIVDLVNLNSDFTLYPFTFKFVRHHGSYYNIYDIYLKDSLLYSGAVISNEKSIWTYKNTLKIFESNGIFTLYIGDSGICRLTEISSFGIPYNPGSWEWDKNYDENKTETGDLPLPIPGDLGNLLGKNPSDIWGNTDSLVGNGDISIPNVDNPSIGIGGSTSFPNVSVENPPTDIPGVENPPTDIPGVENPPVGVIPPFPSFGNSLDFSPMYLTNINEKFPFSLPWDIGRLIEKFDIEPKAPIFKVPIFTSEIELDLTIFDEWANIVRFFVLIGFVLSLILISTKLLG